MCIRDRDIDGTTPLHWAVLENNNEIVDAIIEAAKDSKCLETLLTAQDRNNHTSLHLATYKNNNHAVNAIIKAAKDSNCLAKLLATQDKKGYTSLHMAIGILHLEIAQAILNSFEEGIKQSDKGSLADIIHNSHNNFSHTALMTAVYIGDTHAIKLLLNSRRVELLENLEGFEPFNREIYARILRKKRNAQFKGIIRLIVTLKKSRLRAAQRSYAPPGSEEFAVSGGAGYQAAMTSFNEHRNEAQPNLILDATTTIATT